MSEARCKVVYYNRECFGGFAGISTPPALADRSEERGEPFVQKSSHLCNHKCKIHRLAYSKLLTNHGADYGLQAHGLGFGVIWPGSVCTIMSEARCKVVYFNRECFGG